MTAFTITHRSIANDILRVAGIFPGDVPLADRVSRANEVAASLPADVVARTIRSFGVKAGRGTYTINGVYCVKCNKRLTNIDSIAAGVGPTCQAA